MANGYGKNKWIWFISILSVIAIIATGCSGNTSNNNRPEPTAAPAATAGNTAAEKTDKAEEPLPPIEISIMNSYGAAEPPVMDPAFMEAFEAYTNSKLTVTWVPNSVYSDKINATMASGDLPDIIIPRDVKAPSIVNAARSGFFWDFTDYLDEFPHLNNINQVTYDNLSIDGRIYGIPRTRPLARDGFVYRKDWLDSLNLKVPTNLDELYEVIRAFALDDPDKNGKNDTYGLIEVIGLRSFNSVLLAAGGPYGWDNKNGVLSPNFMAPEYVETLKFYKRLYDEKLINQDFAITQANQRSKFMNQGQAGIYFGVMDDSVTQHQDFTNVNPNGVLDVFSVLGGPKGNRVVSTTGYSGAFMLPKTSVKTEEQMKRILAFLDTSGDPDMQELFTWGVENVHYKVENGSKVKIDEGEFAKMINVVGQFQITDFISQAVEGEQNPIIVNYQRMMNENEAIIAVDPTFPLISDTYTEIGSELEKIIEDAKTKFVMGQIDEAGWNAEIERWKSVGGDKVIAEYNAEFAK